MVAGSFCKRTMSCCCCCCCPCNCWHRDDKAQIVDLHLPVTVPPSRSNSMEPVNISACLTVPMHPQAPGGVAMHGVYVRDGPYFHKNWRVNELWQVQYDSQDPARRAWDEMSFLHGPRGERGRNASMHRNVKIGFMKPPMVHDALRVVEQQSHQQPQGIMRCRSASVEPVTVGRTHSGSGLSNNIKRCRSSSVTFDTHCQFEGPALV